MGSITLELPEAGQARGVSDTHIRSSLIKLRDELNALLNAENKVLGEKLASGAALANVGEGGISRKYLAGESKPFTWYAPKIIATEESRVNAAFGTLPTADEVTGVVLPTNGKLLISFRAHVKNSVEEAARVAIFLGANQIKNPIGVGLESGAPPHGVTSFQTLYTTSEELAIKNVETADATTGQLIGALEVFAAAGTYNISVQYKASSGAVTAKERKLWVATLGY